LRITDRSCMNENVKMIFFRLISQIPLRESAGKESIF
jgi:hypothetical protein